MIQRRLDGVRDETPKPEKPAPSCADCGTTEDLTYYPSADEHGCAPCSNGEREPQTGGFVKPCGFEFGKGMPPR